MTEPRALDWRKLAGREPPHRAWAISGWLGIGHTTLLVGPGGIGKTLLAQQLASCLAIGRPFVGPVDRPHRVLFWGCEDDAAEFWRRQVAIARWLDVGLESFADNLLIVPRHGADNAMVTTEYGKLMFTSVFEQLRADVSAAEAEVVVLDNAAQLYGANENDRHQVTTFLNALAGALPGRAVLLLAHPSRGAGSEYSGSSAWENTARTRLYLGDKMPDQKGEDGDATSDDVRFLARRKANYSPKDWRRLTFTDGVLIPDEAAATGGMVGAIRERNAERVVLEGLAALGAKSIRTTEGARSPDYLPLKLIAYHLAAGHPKGELAAAMRRLRMAGQIDTCVVGRYPNRNPMEGLAVVHK